MTNQEVLTLLLKIDNGYKPTGAEKDELSSIERITWLDIDNIPVCIDLLIYLKELNVSGDLIKESKITSIPNSIGNLACLQRLKLSHTQISALPESIGNLTSLRELFLSETRISALPESIGNLTSLQILDLRYTQISALPESIGNLTSLQILDLSSTKISSLPESIGNLTSLLKLYLGNTKISAIPESIGNLTSLHGLDLSNTRISELPESIGNLTSLKYLFLENMNLAELPENLLHLNLEYINQQFDSLERMPGIYIYGLKLQNQPIEIFHQNRELILEYYKSFRQNESIPINECKVVFLGDGGVGKSLIIDRLMHDGNKSDDFGGESTPGIHISSKKYLIGNEEIELHFWDFGGQAIMHSMHRLFLTNRTLYVVVTNARDNKANEQAWYWIRNIKSFANGAPVLLLVNQKDQYPSANVNENGLRNEYPSLRDVRIISALKDSKEEFLSDVSDSICSIVSKMDTVHTPFSKAWLALMNDLQKMPDDIIKSQDFYEKCRKYGIGTKIELLDQIINWYQDLGVCFYSNAHPTTSQYMVLKPKWLLNALYTLVFNGRNFAKNGILFEKDIYTLLCERISDDVIRTVWRYIVYNPNEVQYIINVLLNYELIYRLDAERFFIPMLCDEDEPNILDYYDSEEVVHIRFKYWYLPENIIHRLMIRHGYELNTNVVWRTGAIFERKQFGWSSLVCMRDNCLDIYAKSEKQDTYPVSTYLDTIRESVYKINHDFNMSSVEYIAYRTEGKEDWFEYDRLIGSKKQGIEYIYSSVFVSALNIDDILGVIGRTANRTEKAVFDQMISVLTEMSERCVELQKRGEVELTADFQSAIGPVFNEKFGFQISREYTMGRAKKKIGETDLYFFTYKDGIKQEQYILTNKVLESFSNQYIQLMGYLNPNFSAGITLSVNKKMGWEEAYDFICGKLKIMQESGTIFAPISVDRIKGSNGTRYVKTKHIMPETGTTMTIYHLVMQLSMKKQSFPVKEKWRNKQRLSLEDRSFMEKRLPVGIQSFEKMRMGNYLYIDKTDYIYQLAHDNVPFFLSRPRRFGKSLLLSTMKAYWEGKKELFAGLAIETKELKNKNAWKQYPVFFLDFNGVNYHQEGALEEFLGNQLKEWEDDYGIDESETSLSNRFQTLLVRARELTGMRSVILVDEYDKPLLDVIDERSLQEHNKEVFKGFFSVLKKFDDYIHFVFITGVSKFHKVSIFSDMNQLNDISLSEKYAGLCGITEKELKESFFLEIDKISKKKNINYDECIRRLRERYDGYHFHPNGSGVYNPYSVLKAFYELDFGSYWFETGTPTFLIKEIRDTEFDIRKFSDGTLYASEGTLKDYTGESKDLVPLLYQSGYLTIVEFDDESREYTLAFPNDEVKYGFIESLMSVYFNNCGPGSGNDIFTLRRYIENGDTESIERVLKSLFAGITYTHENNPFEHYFQAVIYIVFTLLKKFVLCEMHTNTGRIDCIVETKKFIYLFEFKRDETAEIALAQIDSKDYSLKFTADSRKIIKIGANFDSKKRNLDGWMTRIEE